VPPPTDPGRSHRARRPPAHRPLDGPGRRRPGRIGSLDHYRTAAC